MRYEFVIPNFRPATINEMDGNRWRRHRLKKRDREVVAFHLLPWLVWENPARDDLPPRRVSLRVIVPPGGCPDPDALFKSLNDALVHCGALRDDSAKWCRLGPVEFTRGKVLSTTIILEDLEETA